MDLKVSLASILESDAQESRTHVIKRDTAIKRSDRDLYHEIRTIDNVGAEDVLSNGKTVGDFLLERWAASDTSRRNRAKEKKKSALV